MAGHLAGKNIAVTGAGNGIGRAIALACAGEGANVVVADYGVSIEGSDPSSEVADAVVAEIAAAGGTAIAVAGDVSQMEVGQRIVDTAVENWGTIDGVACVAGIVRERMLFNMSEEEFDHVVAVHLKGHFTLYKAASAVMRKQETGGSLVGFTSGAFVASTAQANYSAAKGGIVSLTRSAAFALRRYGVNANCIAPAAMTRMSENVPFEIEAGGPEPSPRWPYSSCRTPPGTSRPRSTRAPGSGSPSGTSQLNYATCWPPTARCSPSMRWPRSSQPTSASRRCRCSPTWNVG